MGIKSTNDSRVINIKRLERVFVKISFVVRLIPADWPQGKSEHCLTADNFGLELLCANRVPNQLVLEVNTNAPFPKTSNHRAVTIYDG